VNPEKFTSIIKWQSVRQSVPVVGSQPILAA